jgi:PAS domain S-box-containing protein
MSSASPVSTDPRQTLAKIAPPSELKVLLLGKESDRSKLIKQAAEFLGFSVRHVQSPSLALGLIADIDPVLLIIDAFSRELSLEDICDAIRIPRQVRPLGLLVTERAAKEYLIDEEWGVDELLAEAYSGEKLSSILAQQARVTWLQRKIMDRENEILDSMPNALIEISRDTVVWKANRSLADLVGISRPDFRRELLGFPVLRVMGQPCEDFVAGLKSAIQAGNTTYRGKVFLRDSERILAANITPLQQKSEHYLVEFRDITEEQQAVMAAARRERLATIGNLAVGAAHEIQNPNTFSRVNAGNLRQLFSALKPTINASFKDSDAKIGTLPLSKVYLKIDEAISGVETASRRIEAVVSTLKTFGRSPDQAIESVDPRRAIEEAVLLTKHEVRKTAELQLELMDSLPPVYGASAELSQVFVNLIQNAIKAIEEQNPTTRNTHPLIKIHVDRMTRQELVIAVSDNGPGIAENLQDKIFRPYYTTRRQGEGTGLGLSISSDIMHRFDGDLSVRSKPGQGASFLVALKRVIKKNKINSGSGE